jgi:phosphate-selective porin
VFIAQAMDGSTAFEPVPGLLLDTRLHAAYLLGAWERGAWTPALRLDLFALRQLPETLAQPLSEHGNALTVALNWRPRERVRVTGEWLRIDSHRDQRVAAGLASHQIDQQLQLSLRLSF